MAKIGATPSLRSSAICFQSSFFSGCSISVGRYFASAGIIFMASAGVHAMFASRNSGPLKRSRM